MSRPWIVALGLLALVTASSCGTGVVPIEPARSKQVSFDMSVSSPAAVIVLVVDDADTPDAAELRARAAVALRAALDGYFDFEWGGCGNPDPAAWHDGDVRVLVARPSAPDASALLGWVDVPALAWVSHDFTQAEADALVAATADALDDRLAQPGDSYRPLWTAKRALELVTGARPPEGATETALVESLAGRVNPVHEVLVASTRADESTVAVSTLVPSSGALDATFVRAVLAPSTQGDSSCEIISPGPSRIEQWADLAGASSYAWPCETELTWERLLSPGVVDCGARCVQDPIEVSAAGVASCFVQVDQRDTTGCDAELGRRDPKGTPTSIDRNGQTLRRCEVVQLEGADLEGCRHSLPCSGCAPGFCATEVPELLYGSVCTDDGEHDFPLRFIGGSAVDDVEWVVVTCVTKSPT